MDPLLGFIVFAMITASDGQPGKTCSVLPQDGSYQSGSDVQVHCDSSCIPGGTYWTLNNRRVNASLWKAVAPSHSLLSLRNFSQHRAVVQCHSVLTEQVLGGTTITTYAQPQITSCTIQCRNQAVKSSPDFITCAWEHRADPSSKIKYSLWASEVSGESHICSSDTTSCSGSYDPSLFDNNVIFVRAQTDTWSTSSNPYEFDAYDVFKLNPPAIRLNVSTHVLVQWIRPLDHGGIVRCQVKYHEAADGGRLKANPLLNVSLAPGEDGAVIIDQLGSCLNYSVAARCALGEAPWSDWSQSREVLTHLKESDVKLRLWRTVAELGRDGRRNVRAMWTEIPPSCRGTFSYTVEDECLTEPSARRTQTCLASPCRFSVTGGAHRLNLTVLRDGVPLVKDSVYIPAVTDNVPRVRNMRTSQLQGDILVSWGAPSGPVSRYVIDWTHDGVEYFWRESRHTNVTLTDLLDFATYNVTVTPVFADKAGHGTQARQICSRIGDPGDVSFDVFLVKDKRALVSWSVEPRRPCSGAVVDYTVFYGTAKGPQLNVTLNGTRQSVWLVDLKPDTQYSISIQARASTGRSRGIDRFFKTKRFDPDIITALSVSGPIGIILVLALGLLCAVSWKRFREKEFPNPGLSSLAMWRCPSREKNFLPFCVPTETLVICERVYPSVGEAPTPPADVVPRTWSGTQRLHPPQERVGETPATGRVPAAQSAIQGLVVEPVKIPRSSSAETTVLLAPQGDFHKPYRCQSSAEPSALAPSRPCRTATKQQDKAAPLAVYVTLDMFEQGQAR